MAELTREIARAIAQDAGDRHQRAAGRCKWDDSDWNVACDVYDRLLKIIENGECEQ